MQIQGWATANERTYGNNRFGRRPFGLLAGLLVDVGVDVGPPREFRVDTVVVFLRL